MDKLSRIIKPLWQPLLAIVIGLAVGAIAIAITGESVVAAYQEMWKGAFGSFYYFTNTLSRATPIILIALGVTVAFRAGFFNLGSEGQLVLGAISAVVTALYLPGPGWMKLTAALMAGVIAGGLWSALASILDAKFKMNLLITTLLMNYIAIYFAGYLSGNPLRDTTGSAALPQTPQIDMTAALPKLFKGMSVHGGFIIAICAALLLFVYLKYTNSGYKMRMLGGNPLFAGYGGINRNRMMLLSMFISGGLAGLAGAVEVMGTQYRFLDGALTAPGYAWTGIMATLLARSNPLGALLAAIFLAALQTGGMGMERNTSVPLEVSSIIQAVLILFISAQFTISFLKKRKAGMVN